MHQYKALIERLDHQRTINVTQALKCLFCFSRTFFQYHLCEELLHGHPFDANSLQMKPSAQLCHTTLEVHLCV